MANGSGGSVASAVASLSVGKRSAARDEKAEAEAAAVSADAAEREEDFDDWSVDRREAGLFFTLGVCAQGITQHTVLHTLLQA